MVCFGQGGKYCIIHVRTVKCIMYFSEGEAGLTGDFYFVLHFSVNLDQLSSSLID